MVQRRRSLEISLYVLVCLIWGSTWMFIKIGLRDSPPMWGAALRFIIAAVVLLAFNAATNQRYPEGWLGKWKVAWTGIFTYLASYSFTYLGSQYISSSLASILFAVFPFIVMILMTIMLKEERLTLKAFLGVTVGFLGVVLIFAEPFEYGSKSLLGMILMVCSPLAAAIGTVSIRKYMHNVPVFPMVALQMTLGATLLTVVAALFEDIGAFRVTTASVGALFFLAILGSIVTFVSYYWLLKRLSLVTMSMVALITPIIAILIGALLGETLTVIDYIGAAMVLIGVGVVNLRNIRLPRKASAN